MPPAIEGRAYGAALPGLWCYEAGQPAFGDVLAWFVRTFPRSPDMAMNFAEYNREASALAPGENQLVAIDWWNGNRVPYADKALRGLLAGLDLSTSAVDIYRALMDSICFGARSIVDEFRDANIPIDRIVLTSGLAKNNPFLLQIMSDVLGANRACPGHRQRDLRRRRNPRRPSPRTLLRIFERAATDLARRVSTPSGQIRSANALMPKSISGTGI